MTGGSNISSDDNALLLSRVSALLEQATQQQRRAADPQTSVWVGASAGTGKTKVLTDRVLTLLLRGCEPARLLCLTFTKAAAAEMANRLSRVLASWTTIPEKKLEMTLAQLLGQVPDARQKGRARKLFAKVTDTAGGMKIMTIHSFCQSLLRRFPLEARVAPNFQLIEGQTASEMMQLAIDWVLVGKGRLTCEEVVANLKILSTFSNEKSFHKQMADLLQERSRLLRLQRDYGGLDGLTEAIFDKMGLDPTEMPEKLEQNFYQKGLDERLLGTIAEGLAFGGKKDQNNGCFLKAWLAKPPEERLAGKDGFELLFVTEKGSIRSNLASQAALKVRPDLVEKMTLVAHKVTKHRRLLKACQTAVLTVALLRLGTAVLHRYQALKNNRSLLDYDDLILKARDLLTSGATSWVMFKLDGGLDHVLVDEAQDTNPEQWEVIRGLTEEFFAGEGRPLSTAPFSDTENQDAASLEAPLARTVFVVGDSKQSIYSFQRADPEIFVAMQRLFRQRAEDARHSWQRIDLAVSFRSTPEILEAVDAIFAQPDAQRGVLLDEVEIYHRPKRMAEAGRVELWPFLLVEKIERPKAWRLPERVEQPRKPLLQLADRIADQIYNWILDPKGADNPTYQLPSKGRRMRAGDILILLKRRGFLMGSLVNALKRRGIPVAGVDRLYLTRQIAVQDLMALGRFVLLPEDDLTLATLLKSPFFEVTEDVLFDLAHYRAKGQSLWSRLRGQFPQNQSSEDDSHTDPGKDTLRESYSFLQSLSGLADRVPPFEFYAEVLGPMGGRRRLLRRLGPESRDAIEEFLNAALHYEQLETPSLQGFIQWLEGQDNEIQRDLEQKRDEVRIMTVHGSKGLQAPVVILPDTFQAAGGGAESKMLWLDGNAGALPLFYGNKRSIPEVLLQEQKRQKQLEEEESHRLLYVALTRAEDRLIITGASNKDTVPDGSWYDLCQKGLAKTGEPYRFDLGEASGAVWQGEGRLLSFQPKAWQQAHETIDDDPQDCNEQTLPPWLYRAPISEPAASKLLIPSVPGEEEPTVKSPLGRLPLSRTTEKQNRGGTCIAGFQRGRLLHRLLQSLPDHAPDKWEVMARHYLSSPLHALSEAEVKGYSQEVLSIMAHPEFATLFGPNSRAEVPVTGLVQRQDGRVDAVSGKIDRLLIEKSKITILDFKTNRPSPQTLAEVPFAYLRQLYLYREVLKPLYPNRTIHCCLLWTDEARLMPIPDQVLGAFCDIRH